MDIKKVNNIEDVMAIGELKDLVAELERTIYPLKIQANSYQELFDVITVLKKNWVSFLSGPFVSEEQKYIYLLTELDGEKRNEKLGITDELYEDKAAAKTWYKSIVGKIHPDRSNDKSGAAFKELQEIYKILTDYDEDNLDV